MANPEHADQYAGMEDGATTDGSSQPDEISTKPQPQRSDWFADVILILGFVGCAGVAMGWVDPPFGATANTPPKIATTPSLTESTTPVQDPRFGTWVSPISNTSKWIRTVKLSPAGAIGARATFTVDYVAEGGVPIAGALGEYTTTALIQQDGRGQAGDSEHLCQIQLEWIESRLQVQHKGPCGEAGNMAADGSFSGVYQKTEQRSQQEAPVRDCTKLRTAEEKLFCKDPVIRVARELNAAIFADAAASVHMTAPEESPGFEQADRTWQGEIRRVCLAAESSPDNPDEGKSACFSQSYEARMNWLRIHTSLIHLARFAEKDRAGVPRYAEALASYADAYGALAMQLPMLTRRLRPIIPPQEAQWLEEGLYHRGPRNGLFQSGCGTLGCDQHEAAFEINPETNSVTAALRRGSKIVVYSLEGEAAELPRGVHGWLEQRTGVVREIVYKP
jgi:hypothetical protein